MSESRLWRRMKNRDTADVEAMLRSMEEKYVSACGRFLTRNSTKDNVWTLCAKESGGEKGNISALLVQSKGTMIPVLCGNTEIPKPRFLGGFLRKINIHSVQGKKDEVAILENALEQMGKETEDIMDYDLMHLDKMPDEKSYSSGPENLVIRTARLTDLDKIAVLQAAYEHEEVLPKGSVFSCAASRLNIANIIAKGHVFAAELDGRLLGKINISSVSFTRYMVGGVYVHPDFRGKGIARRMAAEFIGSLVSLGMGVTLFVKKSNYAARKLYSALGFTVTGDYRISYY